MDFRSPTLSRRHFVAAAAASAGASAWPAFGQAAWPNKPVRIIVPQPAGGYTDQMGRMVQTHLQQKFGGTFIVENKPGANMIIGVDAMAKSPADGTTFGVIVAGYVANTSFYPKLPYDPNKDLMGVSLIGVSPLLAAVSNDAPFKTAREVVEYAKANPGRISFGSTGTGSASHLAAELWKSQTGIQMAHIPYKGSVPGVTDLMGGQVQLFFDAPSGLMSHAKAGKIRLIGVAAERRLSALPDVPTFVEQGFAGFTASTFAGVLAPMGTPRDIVQRVSSEIAQLVRMEDTRAKLDATGTVPVGSTPQEFDTFLAQETAKWAKVIRTAGVKPE